MLSVPFRLHPTLGHQRHSTATRALFPIGLPALLLLAALFACGESGTTDPPVDRRPSVSITSPTAGTSAFEGQALTFTGTASDPEDGDLSSAIRWESDADGSLGTGASITAALSLGSHTVRAIVTDSEGQRDTASVDVAVQADMPPDVSITAPADGHAVTTGTAIDFEATATDDVDGDLSAAISWSSDLDGEIGSGTTQSATLSVGEHRIVASVDDSRGQSAADTVSVAVTPAGEIALGGDEVVFSFDLTAASPAPPYGQIMWEIVFDAVDPVTGSDVLITNVYGGAGGIDLLQSRNDTDHIRSGGTHFGPSYTANSLFDPMLDGQFSFGLQMSQGTATVAEFIACGIPAGGGSMACDTVTTTPATSEPPTVVVNAPNDTTVGEGTTITFDASAVDTEDGDLSASIAWASSVDGPLGTGASLAASLSVGSHVVTASATDTDGVTGIDSVNVTVDGLPTVAITAPADSVTVTEGSQLTFTGTASDPENGDVSALIVWASDQDGVLGTAASIDTVLSVGLHAVTASITDTFGQTRADTLTVVVNARPTVTIAAPSDTTIGEGATVTLTGSASDLEDGDLTAAIAWVSNADGALGSGGTIDVVLSVGTHTVTASVADSDGAAAVDSVTVTVDGRPSVSITSPADSVAVVQGSTVTLTGTASDPEDGDLTGSITWTSDLDGALGTGGSIDATLSLGTHTVMAAVTDAFGQTTTDSITVFVTSGLRAVYWINPNGGDWDVGSNWSIGTPPLVTDSAVIDLDGTYVVQMSVTDTVAALAVGGGVGQQQLRISFGSLQVDTVAIVRSTGLLRLTGGTLTGQGDRFVDGAMEWTGGTLSGSSFTRIQVGGTLNIEGSGARYLGDGHTVANAGTTTWSAGLIRVIGAGTINNLAGATFAAETNSTITQFSGTGGGFNNGGTVERTTGTGTGNINVAFDNTGAVNVASGTLSINGGGLATSGSFVAGTGSTLQFGQGDFGGTYTIDAGSSVTGAGTVRVGYFADSVVVAGTYDVTGTTRVDGADRSTLVVTASSISTATLELTGGGRVAGPGAVNTTTFTWNAGYLQDNLTLNVSGTAEWLGTGTKYLRDATVNVSGTTTWSAGLVRVIGAGTINNLAGATFRLEGPRTLTQFSGTGGALVNDGTMEFALVDATTFGRLSSDGLTISLGGAAAMAPQAGYTPTSGTAFDVITSSTGGITGSFSSVSSGWTVTTSTPNLVTITRN